MLCQIVNLTEIINILLLIVTFFTAIATFLTVLEMKRQRRNAYMPELFIADCFIDFYGFNISDVIPKFKFLRLDQATSEEQTTTKSPTPYPSLRVYNIGMGAAKYVKYEWSYDFEKTSSILSAFNKEDMLAFRFKKQQDNSKIFVHSYDNQFLSTLDYHDGFLKFKTDFVNPNNESINEIFLPPSYLASISYYTVLKYRMLETPKKIFSFDELEEIPSICLLISYMDIGGKEHSKKVRIKVTVNDNSHQYKDPGKPLFSANTIGTYHIQTTEIK